MQDKIYRSEVNIVYCLTEKILSDMLTKPLQGKQFREMRSMVMNCPIDYKNSSISSQSQAKMTFQDKPETLS